MNFEVCRRNFKAVGFKGRGAFEHFSEEVPALAKQLLARAGEIESHLHIEIAFFEPKREGAHHIGHYIVGLLVRNSISPPMGMEFIEIDQKYVTATGKISTISSLHSNLMQWANEQGHKRNLESYIVETYHPMDDEEEVQIYLPIY
ncbi:AraC family transcriptional regulator [Ureibacillus aquaedulcis]|uniref:AraC family transcriptional regulator n=1 Tax=Ureibacillus aquaedulcis TaxID=3058421 RepID=A0ABT8GSD8_9BACL|nr:AraC family transcriptional regulator [Ureibacillus sp. BA0131]MDN4494337.1 AraC family transcriptional regulator [Ureibacillus sp. BA0131]